MLECYKSKKEVLRDVVYDRIKHMIGKIEGESRVIGVKVPFPYGGRMLQMVRCPLESNVPTKYANMDVFELGDGFIWRPAKACMVCNNRVRMFRFACCKLLTNGTDPKKVRAMAEKQVAEEVLDGRLSVPHGT